MTQVVIALHRTFHSLRVPNFRLYLLGLGISATGGWIQTVASAWLVLRLTGSGTALGLELAFSFLPILLIGPMGGVVADRVDKRRLLFVTQSCFAVLALALGLLTATGVVELWMIYGLSLLTGIVHAFDHPTRQSFVPEIVGRRDLTNAVSLNSAVFTGARVLGPAVAALVIASVDIAPAFFLNAGSYLAVLAGLWWMRTDELRPSPSSARGDRGLLDGFRYVWRTNGLRLPLIVMAVLFAMSFNFFVLLPLMARREFGGGAGTYGTMLSLMGAGSFVGALLFANRARSGVRLLLLAGIAVGLTSVGAGAAPSLGWEMAALVPLGFAMIAFMIAGNTTLQLTTTAEMRGRVMSLYSVVFLGSTPLGAPIAGWIGEHLGARTGLVAGGVVALLTCLAGFWARSHARDEARGQPATPATAPDTPAPGTATGRSAVPDAPVAEPAERALSA